jgi:hypothetical protein
VKLLMFAVFPTFIFVFIQLIFPVPLAGAACPSIHCASQRPTGELRGRRPGRPALLGSAAILVSDLRKAPLIAA